MTAHFPSWRTSMLSTSKSVNRKRGCTLPIRQRIAHCPFHHSASPDHLVLFMGDKAVPAELAAGWSDPLTYISAELPPTWVRARTVTCEIPTSSKYLLTIMAMVPVRESANRPTGPDGEFESPAVIMSTSELSVENSDQNRRLLEFLVADLKSDWLPSFTHVPAVIRSIAKCLIAVESQDLADLRLVCCPKEDKSNPDG